MAFIDGIEVPDGPFGPTTNIKFDKRTEQWVLADAFGKNLDPAYRAVPANLLSRAALFQDASGNKVGYVDSTALQNYLRKVSPPRDSQFDRVKKELNDTVNAIQKSIEDIQNPDPEVAKLSEKFQGQYLAPGKTGPSASGGFLPLNQDGTVKRAGIKPGMSATPDANLADGAIPQPTKTTAFDAKDRLTDRWAEVGQLSFDESGFPRDEFGNTIYVLAKRTATGSKAYVTSQKDLENSVYKMSTEDIKRLQQAFKSVGQWDYEVNGELNYLTRGKFLQALNTAALETTAQNLSAYGTRDAEPQNLLTVVADAARQLGGTATKTVTQTYITNRETAQQVLDETYLQSIGRKANKKEVDEFYQKVQKEAKARPTVTTRGGSSQSTKAGFTEASLVDMAGAQAEARPEFLAYQLSTNFYNALLGASRLPMEFGAGEAPTTGPLG